MQALREVAATKHDSFLVLLCLGAGGGLGGRGSGSSGPTSGLLGAIKSDERNIAWESKDLSARRGLSSNKVCEVQPSPLPVPIRSPGTVWGTGSAGMIKSPQEDCRKVRSRHQNSSKLWWRGHPGES